MKMITRALCVSTLLIASPAFAQNGEDSIPVAPSASATQQSRPMDLFQDADTDGDGVLSKQEFLGRAEAHFKEMDMDADGLVTMDEMHALTQKKQTQLRQLNGGGDTAPSSDAK